MFRSFWILTLFFLVLSPLSVKADQSRDRSWQEYGIEFSQDGPTVIVARVRPDSTAAKIGFEAGDVVVADWANGFLGPDGAQRIHARMSKFLDDDLSFEVDWRMDLYRPSIGTELTIVMKFPIETRQVAKTEPLPPAMRHLVGDDAMVAIWNHNATTIDTPDLADAAMRILFALSYHVAGCHGPDAVTIPIQTNLTTVTRDGFGTERARETDTFLHELRVRPAFAPLARRTAPYFSDNVLNPRFVGVRDLIAQDRCDGPRLRQLEEGLAKAAGIALPATVSTSSAAGLGEDWRGFVAECTAASYPSITNNEGGAAEICVIFEAVAREIGDADAYAELRQYGMSAGQDWPQDFKDRFNADFDELYRGERSGEAWDRVATYLQDNGL
jgi:hypothetical protein